MGGWGNPVACRLAYCPLPVPINRAHKKARKGLFAIHDGGRTWRELRVRDGLAKAPTGRSGLAYSRPHSNMVYALVEAENPALLR